MKIINLKCDKCGAHQQPGVLISRVYDMWICGRCLEEHLNKIKEKIRGDILTENANNN